MTNYSIFFNAKLLEKFLILEDHHLNFTGDLSFLVAGNAEQKRSTSEEGPDQST